MHLGKFKHKNFEALGKQVSMLVGLLLCKGASAAALHNIKNMFNTNHKQKSAPSICQIFRINIVDCIYMQCIKIYAEKTKDLYIS
jgi:hypothetical protein